ncbi:MAG: histidine kinase [Lachnospiraceae bacterium]|nr:histidine kinase [Lachnospiraceae bacterium]
MTDTGAGSKKVKSRKSMVSGLRAIMLLIVFLLSVSFLASVFYIVNKERRENITREAVNTLNTLSESISSDIERYKEISRLVMMDEGLVTFLKATGTPVDAVFINNTRSSIMRVLNPTTMVDSVFGFRDDGIYIVSNRNRYSLDFSVLNDPEWRQTIEDQKGGAVISVNADGGIARVVGRPLVSISRVVFDVNTQQRIGMMIMNISSAFIDGKLISISNKKIAVLGNEGTLLSGDPGVPGYVYGMDVSKDVIHKDIKDGNQALLLSVRQIPDMPIYIAVATPIENGFVMYGTVYVILGLVLVFLFAIAIAGMYITRNITKPISDVTQVLDKTREKGTLAKIDIEIPQNEIGVLKDAYNGMVERVNDLFDKVLDNEKAIRRAEMRMLHEQIKPHFLYNSLETIGYLAMEDGAEDVHKALETLGSFYRNFLSKGEREITLRTELNIIKDYLALQKLRYGDILTDEYDIAEDTLNCRIPKLILQPIVENSIYHGIRLKGEMGLIRISSRFVDGLLHLSVYDTGIGMPQEQIDEILTKKSYNGDTDSAFADIYDTSDSFGLWGTIERVRGFCGRDDVVNIRSEQGEFTEVEFVIKTGG